MHDVLGLSREDGDSALASGFKWVFTYRFGCALGGWVREEIRPGCATWRKPIDGNLIYSYLAAHSLLVTAGELGVINK